MRLPGVAVGPRTGPMYAVLEREAKDAGLPLNWPRRFPDTRRALATAEWVRQNQAHAFAQLQKALFAAQFVLGEDIGASDVIDRHARAAGVDLTSLYAVLC